METSRSEPAPRHRFAIMVLLGGALLAASLAGAKYAVDGDQVVPGDAPVPVSSANGKRGFSNGHVDLERGVSALYPLQPGRVTEILAEENKQVKKGDPIFRTEDTLARAQLARAKADLEASRQ